MNKTITYYEQNADQFSEETIDVSFSEVQNRFAALLPEKGYILDFGCGSGRDTKAFLEKGFRVDATDGSENLCQIAFQNTGINVRKLLFQELDSDSVYDGIWACSSILHLSKDELHNVFYRMGRAVKNGGYIYTSFKYGEFEGYRNDRFFTDFTEKTFEQFIEGYSEFSIIEEWISADARPGRGDEKWLNIIMQKN